MQSSSEIEALIASLKVMRQRESHYAIGDYLHQPALMSTTSKTNNDCSSEPVDAECRSKMIEWCIQIVDHCEFNRETVAIATNLLDRFLETTLWAVMDRSAFQLASITCLYTAIKIHEPQALALKTMSNLSRNAYTPTQIEAMEPVVLDACKWWMHPPSYFSFSHYYCELVSRVDPRYDLDTLLELTNVQLETSALKDYELALVPASTVAFAAVMNAVDSMELHTSSPLSRQELELALADAASIGVDYSRSCSMQDIQIRLYEGIMSTATAPINLACRKQHQQHHRHDCLLPSSPRCVSSVKVSTH